MILYAGPSLSEMSRLVVAKRGITLKPPIKRGDLLQLEDQKYRGKVVIADGYFQWVLSVGHKEIISSISNGMEVYGVSSMGAIRAYELRDYGMKGFGEVYEKFFLEEDFQDDELSLLHEGEAPYRAITEPLVHYRECIDHMISEKLINESDGLKIICELKVLWFGNRTIQLFKSLFEKYTGSRFENYFTNLDRFQIKKIDLINCLEATY